MYLTLGLVVEKPWLEEHYSNEMLIEYYDSFFLMKLVLAKEN